MNEKLKPCPFCGYDKAKVMSKKLEGSYSSEFTLHIKVRYYVMCNRCHAESSPVIANMVTYIPYESLCGTYTKENIDMYKQQAIEKWNRRAEK